MQSLRAKSCTDHFEMVCCNNGFFSSSKSTCPLWLIFGFSRNEVYDANIPVSKNGIFGTPEVNYDNNGSSGATGTNNEQNMTNTVQKGNNTPVNKEKVNFCGNCGTKLNSDTKFCPNCGKENL